MTASSKIYLTLGFGFDVFGVSERIDCPIDLLLDEDVQQLRAGLFIF